MDLDARRSLARGHAQVKHGPHPIEMVAVLAQPGHQPIQRWNQQDLQGPTRRRQLAIDHQTAERSQDLLEACNSQGSIVMAQIGEQHHTLIAQLAALDESTDHRQDAGIHGDSDSHPYLNSRSGGQQVDQMIELVPAEIETERTVGMKQGGI
jgi:hypothetical protein